MSPQRTRKQAPVVVGYDGTGVALAALRWAIERTAPRRPIVVVTSVGREEGLLALPDLGREDRARAMLEALWMEDAEALDCEVELVTDDRPPSECLARIAAERDAELIVVGHQRRSGLDAALHRTTAGHTLDRAPCPVVVVPSPKGCDVAGSLA